MSWMLGTVRRQLNPARLNIFSSHSWRYSEHREAFHTLLEGGWVKGTDFLDLSIPEEHPEDADCDKELVQHLKARIAISDVVLVFASMYADRPWIREEVTIAEAYDKPILAISRNGQDRHSRIAMRYARELVHWRGASLRAAILRHLPEEKRTSFLAHLALRDCAQNAFSSSGTPAPYFNALRNGSNAFEFPRTTELTRGLGTLPKR